MPAGAEFSEEIKRWPSEHYAKVAEMKIREGWQVWLFGSKNDHGVGEDIRQRLIPGLREEGGEPQWRHVVGRAIDLLSCADAVVSSDSGLMHVAAALNRPLVAVYGSTSPGFTPPLATRSKWYAWVWIAARALGAPAVPVTTTACASCCRSR